jgi:hypothetical protein
MKLLIMGALKTVSRFFLALLVAKLWPFRGVVSDALNTALLFPGVSPACKEPPV